MTDRRSPWMDADLDDVRDLARTFCEKEIKPHIDDFIAQKHVDRQLWNRAGEAGLLCLSIPEEYGGGGGSFAHEAILIEEQARVGDSSWGASLDNGIVAHYLLAYGTEEQKQQWLPKMATGEVVGAIAMTEPGTGSDLQNIKTKATREGDEYVITGSKTFITNGSQADLVLTVVKTDPEDRAAGISLMLVPTSNEGFARGRVLDKIGMKAVKLPSREDYKRIWKTVLRSCGIGTFIGILPAEGATVASMIGYAEARRWSKNKEEFGKGAIEGIAGAEAANNAATGGAMVPTMVLGIPGSGTTAVILVGLMVHGLRPGPYLFTEQVDKVYQIFGAMLLANLMFMVMGLYASKLFARISLVPLQMLWPIVFALAVIGAYALSSSLLDVWIALIFGVIGFLARRHGFAVAPIAVGLILGEMVETNFQNSLKMFDGDWWQILTQPLAALFLVLAFLGLFSTPIAKWFSSRRS